MKILLVEDQVEVLECLRSYFEGRGNTVTAVSDAEEALATLERGQQAGENFELAFVDLLLPKGHGRQVIQEIVKKNEIASDPAGPRNDVKTRVIVVTASDDLELRQEMLNYGVSDYLFKPITVRDLERLLLPPEAAEGSAET